METMIYVEKQVEDVKMQDNRKPLDFDQVDYPRVDEMYKELAQYNL